MNSEVLHYKKCLSGFLKMFKQKQGDQAESYSEALAIEAKILNPLWERWMRDSFDELDRLAKRTLRNRKGFYSFCGAPAHRPSPGNLLPWKHNPFAIKDVNRAALRAEDVSEQLDVSIDGVTYPGPPGSTEQTAWEIGKLKGPKHLVVFGEQGAGKTSCRITIEDDMRDDFLIVDYLPQSSITSPNEHIQAIAQQIFQACNNKLQSYKQYDDPALGKPWLDLSCQAVAAQAQLDILEYLSQSSTDELSDELSDKWKGICVLIDNVRPDTPECEALLKALFVQDLFEIDNLYFKMFLPASLSNYIQRQPQCRYTAARPVNLVTLRWTDEKLGDMISQRMRSATDTEMDSSLNALFTTEPGDKKFDALDEIIQKILREDLPLVPRLVINTAFELMGRVLKSQSLLPPEDLRKL